MKRVTYHGPSDLLRVTDGVLLRRGVPTELSNELATKAARGRDGRVTIEAADGGEGDTSDGS